MTAPRALAPVLLLLLAGCLGAEDVRVTSAGSTDPQASEPPLDASTFEWTGHIRVGALYEAPAHFQPSERYVTPLWKAGFVLDVVEPPERLEVRLDWTSTGPSELMLMIHAPHHASRDGERGWSEYTNPPDDGWAAEGPLCMQVPPADLVAGPWYPMAHAKYGADIQLDVTVATVGGEVSIPDAYHGHDTSVEELQATYETTVGPRRDWLPCEVST